MRLSKEVAPESAYEQYKQFRKSNDAEGAKIERFLGVDGYDVYNPSVPFTLGGIRYIAGRVEKRECEESMVRLFKADGDVWTVVNSCILHLQDPFVTVIDGSVILGGVSVEHFEDYCIWTTEFYRIKSLSDFEFILRGPKLMKDIRLLQLPDKKIAVFSRPQGEAMKKYNCVSGIGFTIINSLSELTAEIIANAPLLWGQFLPDEWGGCNQLFNLKNGLIGIIGHKSYKTAAEDGQRLHYYGMAMAINPKTREISQTKIIISRDCFPNAEYKRPELGDVTFASGIERLEGGKARIFSGLSDSYVGCAIIPDPFIEYEQIVL